MHVVCYHPLPCCICTEPCSFDFGTAIPTLLMKTCSTVFYGSELPSLPYSKHFQLLISAALLSNTHAHAED